MSIPRKWLCVIYLTFAVAGAILPTLANIDFARNYGPGFDINRFIELANIVILFGKISKIPLFI